MRAVASGTGGTGCDRRSDMDNLRTRDPSNAMAHHKAADFANGVRSFSGSHDSVAFLPFQLEPPLRFNKMRAAAPTSRASHPETVEARRLACFPTPARLLRALQWR